MSLPFTHLGDGTTIHFDGIFAKITVLRLERNVTNGLKEAIVKAVQTGRFADSYRLTRMYLEFVSTGNTISNLTSEDIGLISDYYIPMLINISNNLKNIAISEPDPLVERETLRTFLQVSHS